MRVSAFRGMSVVAGIVLILVVFVAAPSTAIGEGLPVKIYTTTDGLAHNNVGRIVRASRGALSPLSSFFGARGGSGSLNILSGGNSCSWSSLASEAWIVITSVESGNGNEVSSPRNDVLGRL